MIQEAEGDGFSSDYDPHEDMDMAVIGRLQLQLMTDAYVGFLSDRSAVFLRLEYRTPQNEERLSRTQFAFTPKQAKWLGERLLVWSDRVSASGGTR